MRGFSTLLRSREEKGAVFKLLKKRGFEIRSNIFLSSRSVQWKEEKVYRYPIVLFLILTFTGSTTIQNSLASPLAAACRTSRELVLFKGL